MSMDAVILCGGKGTRLRSVVSDRPKPLAAVGGGAFLDLLMKYAAGFGFRRFVLCAGHMGRMIEEHFHGGRPGLEIVVSIEAEPLDTAGAVKNAGRLIGTPRFLLLNGDSFCRADLEAFASFHAAGGSPVSLAASRRDDAGAFGALSVGENGRLLAFAEKSASGPGLVNAGIYMLEKTVLERVPPGVRYSMERDLLPALAAAGQVRAWETGAPLLDIGTPEGYARALEELK
ncbi:MAG: Nucleoside-diphosphate-sugar pyrophosphorylase family protein [Elusimicrobia bacterium]|nr:MAG: Nucleoside-diphosphate-sugar pyrophosphorylase family protein [Elusimicrobiota bacterium]KAF0153735.1 MAG: Nucleoside-diphosphate-sugar pyrophosphorylase family protein [Elusimicrobiota bacterium]